MSKNNRLVVCLALIIMMALAAACPLGAQAQMGGCGGQMDHSSRGSGHMGSHGQTGGTSGYGHMGAHGQTDPAYKGSHGSASTQTAAPGSPTASGSQAPTGPETSGTQSPAYQGHNH